MWVGIVLGETSGGKCTGRYFLGGKCPRGGGLPEGELSLWGSFPVGNCPGGNVRRGIYLELFKA